MCCRFFSFSPSQRLVPFGYPHSLLNYLYPPSTTCLLALKHSNIFNNGKKKLPKLYFADECQLINVEGMTELEKSLFFGQNINHFVIIDSSKAYQWIPKLQGERFIGNRDICMVPKYHPKDCLLIARVKDNTKGEIWLDYQVT